MSDKRRIFISHYHEDAVALSKMKAMLELMGFDCFLAHEDIEPGEHDLEVIEKEIRNCDAFLYVGSEQANASAFCQQEIGMAKALSQPIITAGTKNHLPQGFVSRIQAIKYTNIDWGFYNRVHDGLCKKFPPKTTQKKHLKTLGYEGFARDTRPNVIRLVDDNWNDHNFHTKFTLLIGQQRIGSVKIGFAGQETSDHIHNKLLNSFTHLDLPFFSRIFINESQTTLNENQIKSLKHLLNDTEVMDKGKRDSVANEPVYNESLFR